MTLKVKAVERLQKIGTYAGTVEDNESTENTETTTGGSSSEGSSSEGSGSGNSGDDPDAGFQN